MNTATATLNTNEQQQIDKIREDAAKQRRRQEELDRLQLYIDEAKDRVAQAEATKSAFAARITQIQQLLLQLAGKTRTVPAVDPISASLDGHQSIAAMRAWLADFSRIQKFLTDQVELAEQKLSDFHRTK